MGRKKKIKDEPAVRDDISNAVVSTDKAAYLARLNQKNAVQKERASANRIDVLEAKVYRLEQVVKSLLGGSD